MRVRRGEGDATYGGGRERAVENPRCLPRDVTRSHRRDGGGIVEISTGVDARAEYRVTDDFVSDLFGNNHHFGYSIVIQLLYFALQREQYFLVIEFNRIREFLFLTHVI